MSAIRPPRAATWALMAVSLALGVSPACATTLPPPATETSALVIGRVVVHDMRAAPSPAWTRITMVWQGPADQDLRAEAGYDGIFLLPNLEPGEYLLARLLLVRHTMVRGQQGTESLSLALPLPWTVRAAPGEVVSVGELNMEIRADRTVGVSVVPLSRSARVLVVERLAGTGWAERGRAVETPIADLPEPARSLMEGGPQPAEIDHVVLPYRGVGRSIVVQAVINGRRAGRFLLDTGASVTVISRRLAREADTPVVAGAPRMILQTANGAVQAPLTTLASLQVGGLEVRKVLAAIHDLPGLGSELDGLLGMSFLRYFRVTLDPERQTITLERR